MTDAEVGDRRRNSIIDRMKRFMLTDKISKSMDFAPNKAAVADVGAALMLHDRLLEQIRWIREERTAADQAKLEAMKQNLKTELDTATDPSKPESERAAAACEAMSHTDDIMNVAEALENRVFGLQAKAKLQGVEISQLRDQLARDKSEMQDQITGILNKQRILELRHLAVLLEKRLMLDLGIPQGVLFTNLSGDSADAVCKRIVQWCGAATIDEARDLFAKWKTLVGTATSKGKRVAHPVDLDEDEIIKWADDYARLLRTNLVGEDIKRVLDAHHRMWDAVYQGKSGGKDIFELDN